MEWTTVLFYVFATLLVGSACCVITVKNTVHAALALVLTFFNAAALWILLRAEFLAIVLVLVYVGAVMVLFLFVVMMLDVEHEAIRRHFWRHLPWGLVVGLIMVGEMVWVLLRGFGTAGGISPEQVVSESNTKLLGIKIFTEYLYAFEVAAAILLLGIIAAVVLTLRKRKDNNKQLDPAVAVKVRRENRVRLIKMPAEPRGQ